MVEPPKHQTSLAQLFRDSSSDLDETILHQPPAIKSKTLGALFASTQDLRSLELENEIRDGTSPRGVLESYKNNTGSDEGSPERDFQNRFASSKPFSNWRNLVKQWKHKSKKHLHTFPQAVHKLSGRIGKRNDRARDDLGTKVDANCCNFKASWKIFSLSELKAATQNFNEENLLGKGGFSEVYKGRLHGGKLVAVKRLTKGSHEERITSFLSELGIIAHVDHPNTAKLVGYAVKGSLCLVLELSSLGSLGSLLGGQKDKLDWGARYKIALGIADGLLYLHEHCQRRIIHRDIKSENILLTENYEPQICDYGLAVWLPRQCSHHTIMKYEGTFGYIPPEYIMNGLVDEKTDVFAFGIVLLEIIAGRPAVDDCQQSILVWAKPLLDQKDHKGLIDPWIGDAYDEEELQRMVLTASLCAEASQFVRPRMTQAVQILRGDEGNNSTNSSLKRTFSEELLDRKEYNSTKCLKELHRHRKVAFASCGDEVSSKDDKCQPHPPPPPRTRSGPPTEDGKDSVAADARLHMHYIRSELPQHL